MSRTHHRALAALTLATLLAALPLTAQAAPFSPAASVSSPGDGFFAPVERLFAKLWEWVAPLGERWVQVWEKAGMSADPNGEE